MSSDDGEEDDGRSLRSGNIASGPNSSTTECKDSAEDDMTAAHCGEALYVVQNITMRCQVGEGILHLLA